MKKIFRLLMITYIAFTALTKPNSELNKIPFTNTTNPELPIFKRELESEYSSNCPIQNCIKCNVQSYQCDTCETGYILNISKCIITKIKPQASLSPEILITILVGTAIFFLIFCFLCFYIAHKYRPRESWMPQISRSETKVSHSILYESPQERTTNREFDLSSPQSYLGLLEDVSFSSEVLNLRFLNLETITEKKGFDEMCVICFSSMEMKKLKRVECGHVFHFDCCKSWIMEGNENCIVCLIGIK